MLHKVTFADERVVEAMKDFLCYSVDVESKEGKPVASRFGFGNVPTLLFLDPDATVRDVVVGFREPEAFVKEVARIRRNEGTIRSLRARLAANPEDLEAHYLLAMKRKEMGDEAGYEQHARAILRLDPEGKSILTRRVQLTELLARTNRRVPDLRPLYAFLEKEVDPDLLYRGWRELYSLETRLLSTASAKDKLVRRARWLRAARKLWSHTPKESAGHIGNQIAWGIYETRADVDEVDLLFALEVAAGAVEALPEDPNVVDTFACCLHAVGRKEEALKMVRRCIQLDPKNEEWKKRLDDFRRK